jgi:hypothetical protein
MNACDGALDNAFQMFDDGRTFANQEVGRITSVVKNKIWLPVITTCTKKHAS